MLNISILFGITALVLGSLSEIFIAHALKRNGNVKVLFISHIGSLLVMVPFLFYYLFYYLPSILIGNFYILLCLIAGVISSLEYFFYARGLEVERVSIVLPIANAWPIIVVPLAVVFLSETLNLPEILGIIVLMVGLIIATVNTKMIKKARLDLIGRGVKYGLLSMVGGGVLKG